jgi:hypothetical protein
MKPGKSHWRLEVEWDDSTLLAASWEPIADVLKQRKVVRCVSVGFVIADDKKGVVLAGSVHQGRVAGVTVIPAGQIVKRRRLR